MQLEKEEKWLEKMRKNGYTLQSKFLYFYKFKKDTLSNAKIKIDYREFKSLNEFSEYSTLFKDSGWKHLHGSKWSGTQYFEQEKEDCSDDIFSD